MKFKNDIEVQAGIKDSSGSDGTLGQVLSSTVSGVSWITPPVGITGSGTTNFLPKWSSSTGLTNSIIFNNGNGVSIGATSTSTNSGWRLNIHPDSTQAGLGIFCYNNNSLHGLRIEMTGTGDFIQARDVATQNDVFSVSYLGNTTANSFIKSGGTSSQYLMADGSVTTGPVLTGYVPYTGATQDVDLGIHQLKADSLAVSTTSTEAVDVGEIVWNAIDGTFDMGLIGGVTLQAGQELHIYGKATEVVSNGQAVMFAGVQGDHILISKADAATINSNPEYLIGVATQDFATNDFGYVTVFGNVRGLDTTAYTLGSVLYYDSTTVTDGLLTATMPTAPNAKIEVAAVVRVHSTQGILLVRPHVMPKLKDVQDVYAPTPSNEDGLWWNTANSRYENNSIYGILGYTPADDDQVVKITGDQTIAGTKTFTSDIKSTAFRLTGGTTGTGLYYGHTNKVVLANYTVGGGIDFETNGGAINMVLDAAGDLSVVGNVTANSFIKVGGNSTQYLMADGSVSTSVTARTETLFTATSGQTTFTINYTVGQLDVYYNGSKLSPSEFTAINGTSVTLGFSCDAGEIISIITYSTQVNGALGAPNYIPKFTGTNTFSNSLLYDNGTNVFVGGSGSNNNKFTVVEGGTTLVGQQILMQNASSANDALNIVHSGTGKLIKGTKGVEVFNITNSGGAYFAGEVGIGTTNPDQLLSISSSAVGGSTFGLYNTASNSGNRNWALKLNANSYGDLGFFVSSTNGGNPESGTIAMLINRSGDVGIGTPTPSYKLDVSTSSGENYIRVDSALNQDCGYRFSENGVNKWLIYNVSASDALAIYDNTTQNERIRINSNGRVGIGSAGGSSLLQLTNDGTFPQLILQSTTGVGWRFSESLGTLTVDPVSGATRIIKLTNSGSGSLTTIVEEGNVLIGTTTDNGNKLQVDGTVSASGRLSLGDGIVSNFNAISISSGVYTNTAAISIGASNPTGGVVSPIITFTAPNASYSYAVRGGMYYNGSNLQMEFRTTSDYRVKEDLIEDFNAIDLLDKIKIYDHKWVGASGRSYSVIAHELQNVIPYLVSGQKDAVLEDGSMDLQSVDYSKLVPILIKSIQELKAEIEILKNK